MYLRTEIFKAELAYIKSAVIREFTAKIINILPEYFLARCKMKLQYPTG